MNEGRLVLGLGSNLGLRETNLKRAITRLTRGISPVLENPKLSRVFESPALLPTGAPNHWNRPYLNCALSGDALVGPDQLLRTLKETERSLGRVAGERWAPRSVDIDVLWWPGMEMQTEGLEIPHPEILNRPFVLEPLCDLVPDDTLGGSSFRHHADRLAGSASGMVHMPEADYRMRYPELMGILNVTPDSFSDGGRYARPDDALAQARSLLDAGAAIVDVGAESTRPAGEHVTWSVEWARLEAVLHGLRDLQGERPFRISLDSRNPETVSRALDVGIDLINDVTSFSDPAMLELAQDTDVPLVFMHSLSIPVVKGEFIPGDADPVQFLKEWGWERLEAFGRSGVSHHRLIFDPGIGFGKTSKQNWQILERVEELHGLATPLLIGHSRKSFFERVSDKPSEQRDPETLRVSDGLAKNGVEIVRIHDVERHDRYFREQFGAVSPP